MIELSIIAIVFFFTPQIFILFFFSRRKAIIVVKMFYFLFVHFHIWPINNFENLIIQLLTIFEQLSTAVCLTDLMSSAFRCNITPFSKRVGGIAEHYVFL